MGAALVPSLWDRRSWFDDSVAAAWEVFFFKCILLWTNDGFVAEHRTLELGSRQGIARDSILR
jgi:hypothetical protein